MSSNSGCHHFLRFRIPITDASVQDGALSDNELNHFQVHCFSAPLQPEELSGVKRVVADQMEKVIPRAITVNFQSLVVSASLQKSSLVHSGLCFRWIVSDSYVLMGCLIYEEAAGRY